MKPWSASSRSETRSLRSRLFGLLIEITGLEGVQFGYSLSLVPINEKRDTDHSEMHGDLTVMVPEKDVDNMRAATLAISSNPATPGLAIDNPNGPSPTMSAPPAGDLTGPIAEKVTQLLEQQINPSIASHGGNARLVSEEEGVVYLELGGGCQGLRNGLGHPERGNRAHSPRSHP